MQPSRGELNGSTDRSPGAGSGRTAGGRPALTLTSAAPVAPELSGKADRLPLPLEERLPLLMASQLLPKEPAGPVSRAPVAASATQPVTTPLAQLEVNSELVIDRKPGALAYTISAVAGAVITPTAAVPRAAIVTLTPRPALRSRAGSPHRSPAVRLPRVRPSWRTGRRTADKAAPGGPRKHSRSQSAPPMSRRDDPTRRVRLLVRR